MAFRWWDLIFFPGAIKKNGRGAFFLLQECSQKSNLHSPEGLKDPCPMAFRGWDLNFFGSYKKENCWEGGNFFLVKGVHKGLIFIRSKGWDPTNGKPMGKGRNFFLECVHHIKIVMTTNQMTMLMLGTDYIGRTFFREKAFAPSIFEVCVRHHAI